MRKLALALCILVGLAGCRNPWEPMQPYHQINPLPQFPAIWAATEACVAKTIPLNGITYNEVTWYVVDGAHQVLTPKGWGLAITTKSNRIYFAEQFLDHPMVNGHEMAHAMTGIFEHPDDPFKRCRLTWDTYGGAIPPGAELLR